MGKVPVVLTQLLTDIFLLTLLPAFLLGLQQPGKASFPEALPPPNSCIRRSLGITLPALKRVYSAISQWETCYPASDGHLR